MSENSTSATPNPTTSLPEEAMSEAPSLRPQRWKRLAWVTLTLLLGVVAMAWFWNFLPKNLSPSSLDQATALRQLPHLTSRYQVLLERFVNDQGRVNYQRLRGQQAELDALLAIVAQVSPSSHPASFSSQQDKLAYWINAYNLSVLRAVLHFSDFDNLIPYLNKVRFFAVVRFTYGSKSTNLYNLENRWIRRTFQEPRIHFALNCASFGCPHLPREAFVGSQLETQLDREARKFVAQERNVWIDTKAKTIHLSSIFQWFRRDFTEWLDRQKQPVLASDRILDYINLYRTNNNKLPTQGYNVAYIPYDWRLNRQRQDDSE